MKPPLLVIVSAPSGAGKTTLCNRLLAAFPNDLVLSISSTTRKPRGTEVHGKEYFFLSVSDFEKDIENGVFAEWARVHNNYYGTSREVIEKAFNQKKSVLLDIDVQGAASLAGAYPARCLRIFVSPPSLDELESRLRLRGTDSEETIKQRMLNARRELEASRDFDIVIVNDDLTRASDEILAFVTKVLKTGYK